MNLLTYHPLDGLSRNPDDYVAKEGQTGKVGTTTRLGGSIPPAPARFRSTEPMAGGNRREGQLASPLSAGAACQSQPRATPGRPTVT